MVSPTSGWIVGGSRAFRYDGSAWTEQSTGLAGIALYAVAAASADNVWATGRGGGQQVIFHWNGTQWSTAFALGTNTAYLPDIAMAGPADGWAVGEDYSTQPSIALLFHYDGVTWTQVPDPSADWRFGAVSVAGVGNAWITGVDGTGANRIYHFNNSTWSSWSFTNGIEAIFMLSETQGWAATSRSILHWDGSAWTMEYGPPSGRHSLDRGRGWASLGGRPAGCGRWSHR